MTRQELPHGVRLVVAYDGSGFAGWQEQPGQRTVQGTIGMAVEQVVPERSRIRGASRTDAGVHALAQVAAFDCEREIPAHGWVHALNGVLPDDVVVRQASECEPGYDPRFDAAGKLYRYELETGRVRNPLTRHRAWHIGPARARRDVHWRDRTDELSTWLDLDAMARAAASLEGTHDFRAFQSTRDYREKTVRTLRSVRLVPRFGDDPRRLAIEVDGDAFLKHMVRIIAGTLVDVGRGRTPADEIATMLEVGARRPQAGPTAPGHGLTLVRITMGR